jgi:hypothetical protein
MRQPAPVALLFLLLIRIPVLAQDPPAASQTHQQFLQKLVAAAVERTHHVVRYDPAYVRIPYPNGDVSAETGVCTDEIIRAYRANLMTFFSRKGEMLTRSTRSEDYAPGDLVTWDLGGNVPHIGIVVDRKSAGTGQYLVVHNIGRGPQMEDVLFHWKITGHYRYFGPH